MIKAIGKLSLVAILAALVLGVPVSVYAQDKPMPAPAAPAAKPNPIPFTGKLGAVDNVNKTITLDAKTTTNRVFQVTSETKIMKGGKAATLSDGVVGEAVAGSYVKSADGKLTARSIRFGEKPGAPTPAPAPAPKMPKQ